MIACFRTRENERKLVNNIGWQFFADSLWLWCRHFLVKSIKWLGGLSNDGHLNRLTNTIVITGKLDRTHTLGKTRKLKVLNSFSLILKVNPDA